MTDPNEEPLDLGAWEPQAPPADFAERVLGRVRRRRWPKMAAGAIGAASLAAAIALALALAPRASRGDAIAKERLEVSIGGRARAVLEPGAHVSWNGDDVDQPSGDVFYRVEPGARFRVHTPAGDVEVKGTCFVVRVADMQKRDVKSDAVGAALSALAFVAVYEGKVAVSYAGQRAELAAGDSAEVGPDGVSKGAGIAEGGKAFDSKIAEAADPMASANENLVAQVSEYKRRLEAIAEQKTDLEKKLETTEKQLEAARADGAAPRERHPFDLDADDWKELAKDGTIKARVPCQKKPDWQPSPNSLKQLGLLPQDAPALKEAFKKSNDRLWAAIKPICAQEIGSAEVAEKIGIDTCQHLILDMELQKDGDDKDTVGEAMRVVGEIRAGLRPMPAPNEPLHPVAKMFLAVTAETKSFEADLAQSFGPEEAHRLTFEKGMCMGQGTFGGHGPRHK